MLGRVWEWFNVDFPALVILISVVAGGVGLLAIGVAALILAIGWVW